VSKPRRARASSSSSLDPNLLRDGLGRPWAIDHGTCLFLERIAAGRPTTTFELPRTHILRDRPENENPVDLPLEALEEAVYRILGDAPQEWFAALPFGAEELGGRLVGYLRGFTAPPR
jgi:hypothetical protein